MAKRFLHQFSLGAWANTLAIYSNGLLWGEVWHQAGRSRWAEVAAAVAFLWLLGLLGGSFVVLHLGQNQGFWLPPGFLGIARGVQARLAIPDPDANALPLSRWGLGLVGLGAWFCLETGTQKLVQLVRAVYGGSPLPQANWPARLLPWGLTLLGLGLAGVVFSLISPAGALPPPGLARGLEQLGRWVAALGSTGLSLALVYRLTPHRPVPGLPLWAGVRIALVLGVALLGLRQWAGIWLENQALAYRPLLALGLNLMALYLGILLVPVGAQVNLSSLRYRSAVRRPWDAPTSAPPPPSFESFKIKRRD